MKTINEEYTSYYKYLSDKDKEAFNNAEWVPEETEGHWEVIFYKEKGSLSRIFWDRKNKIKRKPTMEEYYSIHGYNENNNIK